ncbi:MAG: hypothetical protein FJZ49_03410 [Candidatus Verstraetearchaeota archaeon]|nr:hypothetical protein [Candidatus Verstraetearchaeota archaeon]
MAMFNEENIRIVSLDAESRVRGVCQLMEGLIFDLRITPSSSEGEVAFTIKSFSIAMDFLDNYLLMAYSFIEKYRRLKKIDEKEVKKYRRIVERKRDDIAEVLLKAYVVLGSP